VTPEQRIAAVEALMARYNAQDADGYADMMTADACEAVYRGDVLRDGREGVRAGLARMFAEFPQNRADVLATYAVGEHVVLHEKVSRSPEAVPFEVISIYSFGGDKISRVEFVR
jgi:uncharacterized protein (TIGR02246 family)